MALVKYKLLAGGGRLKIINRTVESALRHLGYPEESITDIISHIDTFDTIEDVVDEQTGKPVRSGLKPEHLGVFVNMPNDATVEDIMDTYIEGWKLGLKAIAIYRDGSKRSAPIATSEKDAAGTSAENHDEVLDSLQKAVAKLGRENEELLAKVHQPVRHKLAETRNSKTHKFEIAGHKGYITVGLYDDGSPGELFVYMSKEGSTIGGLMDTVATLTSISLQFGVPLEQLVKKFAYQRFEPSGYTSNPWIRTAHSITDYVFRWLGCEFIEGYKEATSPNHDQGELPMPEIKEMDKKAVNRPVAELSRSEDEPMPDVKPTPRKSSIETALSNIYMDTPCMNCGSEKVIRAGACGVCTVCGTSQGCS